MTYNYILLIILIIILLFLIGYNYVGRSRNKNIIVKEKLYNINRNIVMVVARYNEDLSWLEKDPFLNYNSIVYNKGINDNFLLYNVIKTINLKNVGRCDHTYLYHIITNYDNLADITIFLPGSVNMDDKMIKATKIFKALEKHNNSIFIATVTSSNIKKELYNFQLDEWVSSEKMNTVINNESKLELAPIRPFGKWYEDKFPNIVIQHVTYGGILCIAKHHILQHSKEYYMNLIKELENSSNPEVGHYIERSWEAIFYPMNGAIII
jgi:hypothetical protein